MAGRAEFWAGHIEAQRRSGRSQRAYCAQHELRPRTFRRWALRLQRRSETAVATEAGTTAAALVDPSAGARTSTGTEAVLLPGPVAEILTGAEQRRRWTEEQKLRLVAETLRPGASLSAVALCHGVPSSVLFRWRRRFTEPVPTGEEPAAATATVPATVAAPGFVPVRVVADAPAPAPSPVPSGAAGLIEIELARGQRVRVDRHVDADALRRVLAVLGEG